MITSRPMNGENAQPSPSIPRAYSSKACSIPLPCPPPRPCPGAVVCHPHPLYGGDMDNNVVVAVCRAAGRVQFPPFASTSAASAAAKAQHGGDRDEQADVVAALDFLASQPGVDSRRLCLAGYSFGAVVALTTFPILGSPPLPPYLRRSARHSGLRLACPTLFLFGERDAVAPAAALDAFRHRTATRQSRRS